MKFYGNSKRIILLVSSLLISGFLILAAGFLTIFPVMRLHVWAAFGDSEAMLKLGDITQEMHWYYDACDAGNPLGCKAIWSFAERNRPIEAFEYLKKGAELEVRQRHSYGCLLELSRVHELGLLGQPINKEECERVTKQWAGIQRELRAKGMVL